MFYKHHMLNEMFIIDKWMVRTELYFSLSVLGLAGAK